MNVLIAGASGQVGRALLATVPGGFRASAPSRAELDIGDAQAVAKCVRRHSPDLLINAAAYTAVDKAEAESGLAYRVNAEGPAHLADACREIGARLIQISTDFVFDGTSSVPYSPGAAPHPLNTYGASKLAGEQAVLRALRERAVVLRTAWVYSARGSNFLVTMLRLMRNAGSVNVVADQVGTPTAAGSVATAIWAIAMRTDLHGIHHWTDAGVASRYDFAVAIAEEATGLGQLPPGTVVRPISTAEYPTVARRPSYSVLDLSSLTAALGLVPEHWRVALRTVLCEMGHA